MLFFISTLFILPFLVHRCCSAWISLMKKASILLLKVSSQADKDILMEVNKWWLFFIISLVISHTLLPSSVAELVEEEAFIMMVKKSSRADQDTLIVNDQIRFFFFIIFPITTHTLLPSVLQCLDLIGEKSFIMLPKNVISGWRRYSNGSEQMMFTLHHITLYNAHASSTAAAVPLSCWYRSFVLLIKTDISWRKYCNESDKMRFTFHHIPLRTPDTSSINITELRFFWWRSFYHLGQNSYQTRQNTRMEVIKRCLFYFIFSVTFHTLWNVLERMPSNTA